MFRVVSALFPIVDPIGGSPVFLSLTSDYTRKRDGVGPSNPDRQLYVAAPTLTDWARHVFASAAQSMEQNKKTALKVAQPHVLTSADCVIRSLHGVDTIVASLRQGPDRLARGSDTHCRAPAQASAPPKIASAGRLTLRGRW